MRLALTLLALLFAAPAAANQVLPQPPLEPLDPALVLDIQKEPDSRVAAEMFVNGVGPFRFIIDTGANRTAVSPGLATRLGLPADQTQMVNGMTGAEAMGLVDLTRLESGAMRKGPLAAPVVSGLALGAADGLLAAREMLSSRVVLDFKRERFVLEKSRRRSGPYGATALPAQLRFGQLVMVECRAGGVRAKCILDTGSSYTIINPALYAALRLDGRLRTIASQTPMFGVTQHVIRGDVVQVPDISMAKLRFSDVNVLAADAHVFKVWGFTEEPAILLGMNALRALDLLAIDYPTRTVYVRSERAFLFTTTPSRIFNDSP